LRPPTPSSIQVGVLSRIRHWMTGCGSRRCARHRRLVGSHTHLELKSRVFGEGGGNFNRTKSRVCSQGHFPLSPISNDFSLFNKHVHFGSLNLLTPSLGRTWQHEDEEAPLGTSEGENFRWSIDDLANLVRTVTMPTLCTGCSRRLLACAYRPFSRITCALTMFAEGPLFCPPFHCISVPIICTPSPSCAHPLP